MAATRLRPWPAVRRAASARSTRRKTSLRSLAVILTQTLRGVPFSVSAATGFIAPFDIAIVNGVVLASYIRDLEASGSCVREAATHAAAMPLRRLIMTAHFAALNFLAMALSTSACAEVRRPLATVVIGVLNFATPLTLVVLPAVDPAVAGLHGPSTGAGRAPRYGPEARRRAATDS